MNLTPTQQHDPIVDLGKGEMDLDAIGGSEIGQLQEAQPTYPAIIIPICAKFRRSDRTKKPSTRWNEEAGFLPQPPRSTKKKIPEDPREGAPILNYSSLNSLSDAQNFTIVNLVV